MCYPRILAGNFSFLENPLSDLFSPQLAITHSKPQSCGRRALEPDNILKIKHPKRFDLIRLRFGFYGRQIGRKSGFIRPETATSL